MTTFYTLEAIQFIVGFIIVIGNYFLISHHRKPLLDSSFRSEEMSEKSFIGLTNIIYFLVFIPVLFLGLDLTPPPVYDVTKHIQRVIYFEAGLLIVIGALHFFFMAISARIKL